MSIGTEASMIGRRLFFLLGISLALTAVAQAPSGDDIAAALEVRSNNINTISSQLSTTTVSSANLDKQLLTLQGYLDDLKTYADQLQALLTKPTDQFAKLGPPPVATQPPETADIAAMRKNLRSQVSRLNGLSKQIDLTRVTINQLIGRALSLQQQRYLSSIQTRSAFPFSTQGWSTAGAEILPGLSRFSAHFENRWSTQRSEGTLIDNVILLLVALAVAIGVTMLPRLPRLAQFDPHLLSKPAPSLLEKKRYTAYRTLGHGLLFTCAGGLLFSAGAETSFFTDEYSKFAQRVWFAGIVLAVAWNHVTGFISPHLVKWRQAAISSLQAIRLQYLLLAMILLFVFDRVVYYLIQLTNSGVELATAHATLTNSFFAVLLWLTFSPRLWGSAADSPQSQAGDPGHQTGTSEPNTGDSGNQAVEASPLTRWQDALLIAGRALAAIILLLTCLGYINLANFIFHRVALFYLLWITAMSVRTVARWGLFTWLATKHQMAQATLSQAAPGASPKENTDGDPGLWLGLILDLIWVTLWIPAFLLVVGFDWLVLSRWFGLLSQDVWIGQFSVSFVDILTGLLVLLILNMVTRQVTAVFDRRLLQRGHLGAGERASITTLIRYIGMAVSVLLALGIIGVGWTQLAIIAGALSVGIGFGLQGIVNNFVSGLILLFERPIRVGDWVVVSSGQGYVRNIGARATEIETFDRSSILVPNAELVTGSVENWFYKRRRGRIRINVGVSYKSDPEQVRKILLDCAAELVNVVNYPYAPRVRWLEFGNSSLDFELIAFITDIDNAATTRSDLHFAIFKAFKSAGIEIPFPQRDLHIKSDQR